MDSRSWSVKPKKGSILHRTPKGNPMRTLCGIRFASVSDYDIHTFGQDMFAPCCKKCWAIFNRRYV